MDKKFPLPITQLGDFKLFYINHPYAFFTAQDVFSQWDDNGIFRWDPEIYKIAFDGPFFEPYQAYLNSDAFIEMVRANEPWLIADKGKDTQLDIYANTSLFDFVELVKSGRGYVEVTEQQLKKLPEIPSLYGIAGRKNAGSSRLDKSKDEPYTVVEVQWTDIRDSVDAIINSISARRVPGKLDEKKET